MKRSDSHVALIVPLVLLVGVVVLVKHFGKNDAALPAVARTVDQTPERAVPETQAQRAVAAVRELIASGRIDQNEVLTLVLKEGNVRNFLGRQLEFKEEWERQTHVRLEVQIMPQMAALGYLREHRDAALDLIVARPSEYPDLWDEALVTDLTGFCEQYELAVGADPSRGYFRPDVQMKFDGRVLAIPADGDIQVLFLRRDLMEDPANQAAFEKRYHRRLSPPATWDEYQDLVEFFHRPEQGIYGSCEHRDPDTGWWFWMARYASQTNPNQLLFDDEMHPLIDSPAGVRATRSYLATVPMTHPDLCRENPLVLDSSLTLYKQARGFAYSLTMAGIKLFNIAHLPSQGNVLCCPMPGEMIAGKLIRRPFFIYGNNLAVPSTSSHKQLAFLYAMWFTDVDVSTRTLLETSGFQDPFRVEHLADDGILQRYGPEGISTLRQSVQNAIPPGIGLPGSAEYAEALGKNLHLAVTGGITAQEAMKRTAAAWEATTDRRGREKQMRYWHSFREGFPAIVESAP